jgi:predicted dehydrogenase
VLKAEASGLCELFFGRISFRSAYDVFRNQPYLAEDPRFIIADLGVHLLDLARFFFGEVEALVCSTQRIHPAIKGEDVATILLKMRSGATCLVDLSYATQLETELFPQTLVTLEGRAGCVTLGPHYELTTVRGRETTHRTLTPPLYAWSQPVFEFVQDSVVSTQQHWIDCLHTGRETETSGSDNLKTLDLVFGSYRSAETGETYYS